MTWERLKDLLSDDGRFWCRLECERRPAVLGDRVFSTPAFVALFGLIDRFGSRRGHYELSVTVRFLMMMTLCHRRVIAHFADQLETDEAITELVLGAPQRWWSSRAKAGIAPDRRDISKWAHAYMGTLLPLLEAFYYELVRLYIQKHPEVRFGLCFDGSKTDTHGHPKRRAYARDPETGERRVVGTREATDPDAARWVMRVHNPSRLPSVERSGGSTVAGRDAASPAGSNGGGRTKQGFGFHVCNIRPLKKGPILAFEFNAPKKGHGEPNVVLRLIEKMLLVFPEMQLQNGEFGIFVADTGLEGRRLVRKLFQHRYHAVIPVKRTLAAKLLRHERLRTHGEVLRVRRDGVPHCAQGPLKVLASDMGAQPASRFRCPMTTLEQCPTPCALRPFVDAKGRLRHPIVKRSVSHGDDLFRYPLIPRRGRQFRWLFDRRTANERDFSYFKARGSFSRLPIRGRDNHALRLLCMLIVLTALALLEDGIELTEDVVDRAWPTANLLMRIESTIPPADENDDGDDPRDEIDDPPPPTRTEIDDAEAGLDEAAA